MRFTPHTGFDGRRPPFGQFDQPGAASSSIGL
jgi:hypothetical protein